MSGEPMSELALYLEKQRQMRELSEELEKLKSNQAVESAMRIKHEIDALLADYDLTPEQLLEALCTLFDLAKPFGYGAPTLLPKSDESEIAPTSESTGQRSGSGSGQSSTSTQGRKSPPKAPRSNHAMVPAKSVQIGTRKKRPNRDANTAAAKSSNAKSKTSATRVRVTRTGKRTYTNPHTGESVVTRGSNHRTVNQWREQYGSEEVEKWLVKTDD